MSRVVVFGPSDVGKTLFLGSIPQAVNLPGAPGDFELRMVGDAAEVRARMEDALRIGSASPDGAAKVGTMVARKYNCELSASRYVPELASRRVHHHLELELWDTPGAELSDPGTELARRVREAEVLVLCLDPNQPSMVGVRRQLSTLAARAAETQYPPSEPASWWSRTWARLFPADWAADRQEYRAFGATRVLVLLTRIDERAVQLELPPHSALAWAAQLDPVAEAARLLGPPGLAEILSACHREAEVAVGVVSAWGFCSRHGVPYVQAQSLPNAPGHRTDPNHRVRDWQPFGVRDALRFILTGEASGRVRRLRSEDTRSTFGPLAPLPPSIAWEEP